jgi:hypothetical protein
LITTIIFRCVTHFNVQNSVEHCASVINGSKISLDSRATSPQPSPAKL